MCVYLCVHVLNPARTLIIFLMFSITIFTVIDQTKTLFRTQDGFKLFSEHGPVRQTLMCKVGEDGMTVEAPCHGHELASASICLFTTLCMQNPENLKTLLGLERMPEVNYVLFVIFVCILKEC